MRGSDFPEAVGTLLAPDGLEKEVYGLPVWYHEGCRVYISKWRMTWRERLHCLILGHVWLHVWGDSHPPVSIEVGYPFEPNDYSGALRSRRIRKLVAVALVATGSAAAAVVLGFLAAGYR